MIRCFKLNLDLINKLVLIKPIKMTINNMNYLTKVRQ